MVEGTFTSKNESKALSNLLMNFKDLIFDHSLTHGIDDIHWQNKNKNEGQRLEVEKVSHEQYFRKNEGLKLSI